MLRKITYLISGIIAMCILTLVLLLSGGFLRSEITSISVDGLLQYPGGTMTVDNFLLGNALDFGLNQNDQNAIRTAPDKYRLVNIHLNIDNKFNFIAYNNAYVKGTYSKELSSILVGKINSIQSDDTPIRIPANKIVESHFRFIVNAEGKSDLEIIKSIESSDFGLDGLIFPKIVEKPPALR